MTVIATTFPRTAAQLEANIAHGLDLGAQVAVRRSNRSLLDVAVGEHSPGRPLRPDALMPWHCATKLAVSTAIGALVDSDDLSWDSRIGQLVVRGLADDALRDVTLRQLLTHVVAFDEDPPFAVLTCRSWEQAADLARGLSVVRGWPVGRRARYSQWAGFAVLGLVIEAVAGEAPDVVVRRRVFEPLGMRDSWLALDVDRRPDLAARLVLSRSALARAGGPGGGTRSFEEPEQAGGTSPGGSGRGPAGELALLVAELLRARSGGGAVLSATTARAMTSPQRTGLVDEHTGTNVAWGLGVTVDAGRFSRLCGPGTFGHTGLESVTAFADPRRDLVIVAACNGHPGARLHWLRQRRLVRAIYEDLGFVAPSQGDRRRAATAPPRSAPDDGVGPVAVFDPRGPVLDFLSPEWVQHWAASLTVLCGDWPSITGASGHVVVELEGLPGEADGGRLGAWSDGRGGAVATYDVRDGRIVEVRPGRPEKPDVSIRLDRSTAVALLSGRIDHDGAVGRGALRIGGSLRTAMRLWELTRSTHYHDSLRMLGAATRFPEVARIRQPRKG